MPRLTDTQLVILSAAAQRDSGAVLPLPKTLKLNPGTAGGVIRSLLKKALIAERTAAPGEKVWREARDGERIALAITAAGLMAIGVESEPASKVVDAKVKAPAPKARKSRTRAQGTGPIQAGEQPKGVTPGTKMAQLIEMLGRKNGVTIEEIAAATGWQTHSVRGAISGAVKKKLGLAVASQRIEGRGRVYWLDAAR